MLLGCSIPAREVSTLPPTGTRRWCRPIPRSSARRIQPQYHSNPSQQRRSERCSSTPMRLPILSLRLQTSPHQSASPVPASSTILPTHRLLSSATRRTFFSRFEHRRQRHHNHQRRWAHRIRRQRQRRECTLHHPRRRRIRHDLPVEWRDDGRLDRGRGNFLSGLKPAHRRQQQSLDHGKRCYQGHRRRAGQGR